MDEETLGLLKQELPQDEWESFCRGFKHFLSWYGGKIKSGEIGQIRKGES